MIEGVSFISCYYDTISTSLTIIGFRKIQIKADVTILSVKYLFPFRVFFYFSLSMRI